MQRLQTGHVALYAQLGSILRSKIVSGDWPNGTEIPTLDELQAQYKVSRITARLATQMLTGEGLLSSQRGRRTFVTVQDRSQDAQGEPLFSSIGGVQLAVPRYSIEILAKEKVSSLPPGWFIGSPADAYTKIRKVDRADGQPYSVSTTHIAHDVFRRFPKGAERRQKLARLVLDHSEPKLAMGRERVTVAVADYEDSALLDYPMSSPVARVQRIFVDTEGRIVYFGTFTYRGDKFGLEHDLDAYVRSTHAPRGTTKAGSGRRPFGSERI